jgi:hypothetical protein
MNLEITPLDDKVMKCFREEHKVTYPYILTHVDAAPHVNHSSKMNCIPNSEYY